MEFKKFSIVVIPLLLFLSACDTPINKTEAYLCFKLRKYDEAIESYRKALLKSPNDASLHCSLGKAYVGKADAYKSSKAFKAFSIGNMENILEAKHKTERLIDASGIYDKAILEFKKTLELDPENFDAYLGLGPLYCRKGKKENAIKVLKEAVRLRPKSAYAHLYLGTAYGSEIGGELGIFTPYWEVVSKYDDIVKGIEEIEKAIRLRPMFRLDSWVRTKLNDLQIYKSKVEYYRQKDRKLAESLIEAGKHAKEGVFKSGVIKP